MDLLATPRLMLLSFVVLSFGFILWRVGAKAIRKSRKELGKPRFFQSKKRDHWNR